MARKLKANGNGNGHAPEPKKRGRKAAEESSPPAEITDQQKREAQQRLYDAAKARKEAKAKFDSAHSGYRAAFKEACKVTGFTKEAMTWHMANREREPHEVDAEMRDIARIAQWTNMASGFQASFNFDALTNAPSDDAAAAEAQGYKAGDADRPKDNPYPEGDVRCVAWDAGYMRRQVEIAKGMGAQQ